MTVTLKTTIPSEQESPSRRPAKLSKPELEAQPQLEAGTPAAAPPKAPKPMKPDQFAPVNVTGVEAWRIMKDEGIASVSALVQRLKVDGIVISERTLRDKLAKVPEYYDKYLAPKKVAEEVKIALEVAAKLAETAPGATSKTMHGLYTAVMIRLGELVPQMTPSRRTA